MSQVSPDSSRIADALRDRLSALGLDLEAVELDARRQAARAAGRGRQGRRRHPRRHRRRDPGGLRRARRLRPDGRDGLHPRGHLAGRRPAAHRAAPLAPQPRPPGQGLAARRHPAHRPRRRDSDDAGVTLDVAGSPRRLAYDDVGKALVQIEFNRKRTERRPDGHRPEHPAHARAGEGDLLRRPRRGHRAGAADGVPQDAGRRGAGAGRARPQAAATSPCSPRSSTTRAPRSGSTTTPPRGSAGSPRRRRSRSCCSGCATPRTTSATASSPARRAT